MSSFMDNINTEWYISQWKMWKLGKKKKLDLPVEHVTVEQQDLGLPMTPATGSLIPLFIFFC